MTLCCLAFRNALLPRVSVLKYVALLSKACMTLGDGQRPEVERLGGELGWAQSTGADVWVHAC